MLQRQTTYYKGDHSVPCPMRTDSGSHLTLARVGRPAVPRCGGLVNVSVPLRALSIISGTIGVCMYSGDVLHRTFSFYALTFSCSFPKEKEYIYYIFQKERGFLVKLLYWNKPPSPAVTALMLILLNWSV